MARRAAGSKAREPRLVRAAEPFPQYKDYHFGKVDDPFEGTQVTDPGDRQGGPQHGHRRDRARDRNVAAAQSEHHHRDLRTRRPHHLRSSHPARPHAQRSSRHAPRFDYDEVEENTPANLDVIAVDQNGLSERPGLSCELVNEDTTITGTRSTTTGGSSRSRATICRHGHHRRQAFAASSSPRPAGAPIASPSPTRKRRQTSYRFWSGWGRRERRPPRPRRRSRRQAATRRATTRKSRSARPRRQGADRDRLDKILLAPGRRPQGGAGLSFRSSGWGAALTPSSRTIGRSRGQPTRAPVRAIGLAWLAVDARDRTLGSPSMRRKTSAQDDYRDPDRRHQRRGESSISRSPPSTKAFFS